MKPDRSYETMTSKERVLRTINHEKPDRVPLNYITNTIIDTKLKGLLGIKQDDNEGLLVALGVDLRAVDAPYTGKPLHVSHRKDRYVDPQTGWVTRYIENESGAYWDYCDFPLINADEEEIASWKFPNPDDYDYNAFLEEVRARQEFALYLGNPGLGCIINTCGFLRGMEQVLVDLVTDDPGGLILIDKLMKWHLGKFERELDKAAKLVDLVWMGEDLGTQHTPLISKEIFYKHILPWHKQFIELANAYNLPVMMHTCGSSSWSYEDYIGVGLKGVETLQPEATNMTPKFLKDNFGGRLFFHGCVSTAGALAYGSVDDVVEDVRQTLEIMMPGSGYILSPTHAIQDNSPPENVVAMYEAAHKLGKYA
ncbi:MAG: hypothetical protein FWC73_13140 [Defluviitaleaceae bacterium]|nr:hypothetical protein [Defluviitaleaceae bacterium]